MLEKKIKILAVGDLHGDERFIQNLAKKAESEKVDVIILAGDLVFSEDYVRNIVGPFTKLKKPVLLIPGNHESNATINFLSGRYANTFNLHEYHFIKNDTGIFGAGGADIGLNLISDSEIFYILKKGHEKVKNLKKKIMVTHIHPEGSKSEFSGFRGSKGVRKALEEFNPDILINAHIHEAGGIEEKIGKTRVFNVSGKEKIFEI